MDRELLEQMTKEELVELASRQSEAIDRLDEQRYNASAVIDHLVSVSHELHNLRYHERDSIFTQDRLDYWVREMYGRHPSFITPPIEDPGKTNEEAECEEELPSRSDVVLGLETMRYAAEKSGFDGYVETLSRAIKLLEEETE